MATPSEILEKIELYILSGGRRTVAIRLKEILSDITNLLSGGSSTFEDLTDSPYDNILLAEALGSKQDRINGIVSGCEITVETFVGVGTNKRIRVSKGAAATNTWYISPSEYSKLADTVSLEITLCPTGGDFKYYDIVADNIGAIAIHEGTPSTSPAHYTIDPVTEVLLGFITVGDAVIEEPVPTTSNIIDDGIKSYTQTWSSVQINNINFRQLTCNTIAISNQDIYTQTIQGVDALNSLFTAQSDPADNGFYGWNGVNWTKAIGIAGYSTEYYFLSHCIFTAQQGTEVGKGYLLNTSYGPFQFVAIGASGLTQSSQAQVEAAFDNTNQTTPVVLEQTSALTPFNAWWLVQKIKTFFSTTANQTDSTNKRFVTDAEKVVIGNTSNTNSGNETASSIGALLTVDTTPLDTDLVVSWDGTLLMKTTFANIKAFFKTYFDTIYGSLSALALKADKINNSENTSVLFWDNGIGSDLAGFYYDKVNKILNVKGTLPTIKIINGDGSYSQIDRSQTANTFKLRNYVLQAGGIGKALVLNGTNQYATASGAGLYTNGGAFSASIWLKTSSVVTTALLEVGTESGIGVGIGLDVGEVKVLVSAGIIASGVSVSDGNWHHILFCFGSGNISVYIDSILRINYSYALNATVGTLRIGNSTVMFGGTTYFNGLIDQVLVYNTKLTAGNATSLYNSGAGNATIPSGATRRYEIEEGAGSVLVDSSASLINATLFNSPTWTSSGKVPVSGAGIESTIIESSDGLTNGERGVHKIGEFNGTTQIQGRFIRGLIDIYYWFITDGGGNVLFDSGNTSTGALPTAKVTVGAPTSLIAGFRLIAGVLNTSSINLGDFIHNLAQRTYFKRVGASTANSIWLADVGVMFTAANQITVANTVTASTLLGTAVTGMAKTFPANFFVVGKMAEIELNGIVSITTTDTLTIDTILGGINISTGLSGVLGSAITNAPISIKLIVKCESVGASGTFSVTGFIQILSSVVAVPLGLTKIGTTTINTTIAQTIDVKNTWSAASASNTISIYNSKIKIIN